MTSKICRSSNLKIAETSVAQSFLEVSTAGDRGLSRLFFVDARRDRRVDIERASHAVALPCQHFLKQDAVFFDVLVYSGMQCISIPGCTQRLSHLTTSGGQYGEES
jgi:hypothetical protein